MLQGRGPQEPFGGRQTGAVVTEVMTQGRRHLVQQPGRRHDPAAHDDTLRGPGQDEGRAELPQIVGGDDADVRPVLQTLARPQPDADRRSGRQPLGAVVMEAAGAGNMVA